MSKLDQERFAAIREAFMIRRFHTVSYVSIPDTVGHHTANLINILFFLYDENPPIELVRAALHHDVAELITGDIPAPTKWRCKALTEALDDLENAAVKELDLESPPISELDRELLKYADMMDLCFKSVEELSAGNLVFDPILSRGINYIFNQLNGPLQYHQKAKDLLQVILNNRFIEVYTPGELHDSKTTKH